MIETSFKLMSWPTKTLIVGNTLIRTYDGWTSDSLLLYSIPLLTIFRVSLFLAKCDYNTIFANIIGLILLCIVLFNLIV